MNKYALLILALVMCALGTSCSSDDDYQSSVPQFSDIVFSSDSIYVGEMATATAVQSRLARLVDRTTYGWQSSMPSDSTLSYTSAVMYPDNTTNPKCSFRAPSQSGTYTIEFIGSYNFSGQSSSGSSSVTIKNGTVTYSFMPLKGVVTITKEFKVYDR